MENNEGMKFLRLENMWGEVDIYFSFFFGDKVEYRDGGEGVEFGVWCGWSSWNLWGRIWRGRSCNGGIEEVFMGGWLVVGLCLYRVRFFIF